MHLNIFIVLLIVLVFFIISLSTSIISKLMINDIFETDLSLKSEFIYTIYYNLYLLFFNLINIKCIYIYKFYYDYTYHNYSDYIINYKLYKNVN